jgi:CheY-like chemotaxis protein
VRLKLSYLARSRLWVDIVHSQGALLFVPTTAALKATDSVTIDLEAPDLHAPLVVLGVVQRVQPVLGTVPAGVFVTLEPSSVERCRLAVGAERQTSTRTGGRAEHRVDCDLPARVLQPQLLSGSVRSLSPSGLTLKTSRPLAKDDVVGLSVTLPEHKEVLLNAVVLWSRPELLLSGLQLTSKQADVSQAISHAVEQLEQLVKTPVVGQARGTVVVADDDPSILDFASRVVTKEGFSVVRAERGDHALEAVLKERPVLVLLDVLMPGLDGLEVCAAIRGDAALRAIPVVLLSAMGEDRLVEAAKKAGASAWLTKPMRLEALREVILRLTQLQSSSSSP